MDELLSNVLMGKMFFQRVIKIRKLVDVKSANIKLLQESMLDIMLQESDSLPPFNLDSTIPFFCQNKKLNTVDFKGVAGTTIRKQ